MCGRTVCHRAPDDVCRACRHGTRNGKRAQPKWKDPPGGQKYYSSYNMAPTSHTPILLSKKHFSEEELSDCTDFAAGEEVASAGSNDYLEQSDYVVQPMHWGLVPSWHKGDSTKTVGLNLINARSDGLLSKKTFKTPLEKGRRCVVPIDGYYEWQKKDDTKIPHYIYNRGQAFTKEELDVKIKQEVKEENEDQDPMLMVAGLFDVWKTKEGENLYSYSMITVDAHKDMEWLHHRMPAILQSEEEINAWLDFGSVPLNKALQAIRSVSGLQSHPVSKSVGNVHNKSPDLILPVDPQKSKPKLNASSVFMSAWLKKSEKTPKKEADSPLVVKDEVKTEVKTETEAEIKSEVKVEDDSDAPASKKPRLQ